LLEAILKFPFTGQEIKVILKVGRDTYGWSRKKAQMSYGVISGATGISRRNVIRVCKGLVSKRVLFFQETKGASHANVIGINKNYEEWKCSSVTEQFTDTEKVKFTENDSDSQATTMVLGSDSQTTPPVTARPLVGAGGSDSQATSTSDSQATTSKQTKTKSLNKKTEIKARPLNNSKPEERIKGIANILTGFEDYLKPRVNPWPLLERFYGEGFELDKTWAVLVMSRADKENPAGFFVKTLADPKFPISEIAWAQVSLEKRKYKTG
jgi:phage replication O-like protein O